jgi:hypothetical protein
MGIHAQVRLSPALVHQMSTRTISVELEAQPRTALVTGHSTTASPRKPGAVAARR